MKKRFRKSESGQAMVEFALVLPIMLVLLCGIIDFGWIFNRQINLNNEARDAARYCAVHYAENATQTLQTALDMADADAEVSITTSNGVVTARTADLKNSVTVQNGQVTVEFTENATFLTGFTAAFVKNGLELHGSCTMRLEN